MTQLQLVAAALAAALFTLPASAQFGRRAQQPPALEHFYFDSWDFDAPHARGGEASYYIYLPKEHDHEKNQDRKFPWVLWCPGFGGPDDFQSRGGASTLDRLRGEGKIPELALVVFRAPGRRSRTTYMNGESGGDIEDLIVEDLVAHLQTRYRLSDKREHRAEHVGVPQRDLHRAEPAGYAESTVYRYLRGGIAQHLGDPIDKDKWAEQMPMGLVARRTPTQLKGLQIYFDAGTDDHYGFFEPNQQLAAAMKARGHRFVFHPVEEGGHAWSSPKMRDNVARSLTFVGAALSGEDPVGAADARTRAGKK